MRMTPTNNTVNSGVCTGKVPGDGGTLYFCTQDGTHTSSVNVLRSADVATRATSVLRQLGPGTVTCALGRSGRYLLAGTGNGKSNLIRYDTATGQAVPVPVPNRWAEVTCTIPW